jgi:hypothetical protein
MKLPAAYFYLPHCPFDSKELNQLVYESKPYSNSWVNAKSYKES